MTRFLLAFAAFIVVIYVLRRLAGTAGGRGAAPRARGATPAGATELVKDRVCNTYLPRDRALRLVHQGETHHFCSEDCRSRFQAGQPTAPARTAL